ncbi:hypothetical protein M3Y99_01801600 [Aphelenchoides fujianensis]|nr:hypothetical protein M3Y99_01801600 [Aphelenchoides fujianensis]
MRERWSLAVLLIFALASMGRAAEANQNEDDDIKLQTPQNSCSFYCFILGKEDNTIVQHVNASMRLNCTHVIYGYALVDRQARVRDPNKNDYPMDATWGNYRYLLELTKQQPPITTLLAIREAPRVHFIDDRFARARAIGNMVDKAYYHYFDGLYINLRGASYLSFHYENFVRDLRMEINGRAALKGTPPLKLVIAVDGQDAFGVTTSSSTTRRWWTPST